MKLATDSGSSRQTAEARERQQKLFSGPRSDSGAIPWLGAGSLVGDLQASVHGGL